MISPIEKALLALMIFVIMMGMGCTLERAHFLQVLKKPKAVLLGLLSQFGWMPLIALGLAGIFALDPFVGLGLLLVGCTPGGTTSNLFTYYSRGNVALSIVMTIASTVAAIFMMPLLLSLYAPSLLGAQQLQIPYTNIVATLVLVLLPVGLGMMIRSRSARWAQRTEKVASLVGIAVIVFLIATWIPQNLDLLAKTNLAIYAGALGLGICGFFFGYLTSHGLGVSKADARTVALETGIQNTPLTFAIILITFPENLQGQILWLPAIYAVGIVLSACIVTAGFRYLSRGEAAGHSGQNPKENLPFSGDIAS